MLHECTLLATLSLGLPPLQKTDKRITAEITAREGCAAGALSAKKRLLPEHAIEPIKTLDRAITDYHHTHTLAWTDGARILRSLDFDDYTSTMRAFRQQREGLAREFVRHYDSFRYEAMRILAGAFHDGDYLPVERVADRFKMKLEFNPVPSADDWRLTLHEQSMDALRTGIERQRDEAIRAAHADLARKIAEPLSKMVERLSEPDAVFRDSLVTNLREICDLIPRLNITGDAAIDTLRQRIYADLYQNDPDTLRESSAVRASTARKAQAILDQMTSVFGEPMAEAA